MLQGNGRLFLFVEVVGNVFHLFVILVSIYLIGALGIAIAFSFYCIFYLFFVYYLVNRLTGLGWSFEVKMKAIFSYSMLILMCIIELHFDGLVRYILGFIIILAIALYNMSLIKSIIESGVGKVGLKYYSQNGKD
jgi:hypothetical protein